MGCAGTYGGAESEVEQKQDKADRFHLTNDIEILTNTASKIWLLRKAKDIILSVIRRFSIFFVEPC